VRGRGGCGHAAGGRDGKSALEVDGRVVRGLAADWPLGHVAWCAPRERLDRVTHHSRCLCCGAWRTLRVLRGSRCRGCSRRPRCRGFPWKRGAAKSAAVMHAPGRSLQGRGPHVNGGLAVIFILPPRLGLRVPFLASCLALSVHCLAVRAAEAGPQQQELGDQAGGLRGAVPRRRRLRAAAPGPVAGSEVANSRGRFAIGAAGPGQRLSRPQKALTTSAAAGCGGTGGGG
jgi:hypothetical protein